MTDALKPCPFCGDKPTLHVSHRGDDLAALACENDQCSIGPATDYLPDAQLAAAWNRRAPQPSPATDALADELERLAKEATPGMWKYSPWHIEEGPPVVRAEEGWIIATTSSDANAALIAALVSNLPAILSALREREPVAWRWRFDADGAWSYGDNPPRKYRFGDPEEVQPLYAAPTLEHQEEQS